MDYMFTYEEYKEKMHDSFWTKEGNCPVLESLNVFSGKWKFQIIFEILVHGPLRFNEIKKVIPNITNTALNNALKDLVNNNIIIKNQYDEEPHHVKYSLTEKGKDLKPIFYELTVWGLNYIP